MYIFCIRSYKYDNSCVSSMRVRPLCWLVATTSLRLRPTLPILAPARLACPGR